MLREEDPEAVAAPLDEAVHPLEALADQALGVAELLDHDLEVVGQLVGRRVSAVGRLGQAALRRSRRATRGSSATSSPEVGDGLG